MKNPKLVWRFARASHCGRRSLLCLLVSGAVIGTPAQAQGSAASGSVVLLTEQTSTVPSVFRNTVRTTLEKHPLIQAANARLESSRHGLSAAEWGRYPTLSAEMSRTDEGDSLSRVQLQQPLWAGGRIDGEIDLNTARVAAASASVREAELTLAEQTISAAVDLVKARAQLARSKEGLEAHQKFFDAIKRRVDGGVGLQSDVTLAQARIEQARASLAQYDANERRVNARWLALTGSTSTTLEVPESVPGEGASLVELIRDAKAFSPTAARLRAEAEAAGHDAAVAKAVAWPQLSVRAVHTQQGGNNKDSDKQLLGVLEYQPGAGIGVVDRARAALSQRDAALAQVKKALLDVEEQVSITHADRQGFASRASAFQVASTANAEVIDSFLRQYNIGKRTWLDVLNAQRELTETLLLVEENRYNALAAAYRLSLQSGRFFTP